jgi:hypothetical protein
MIDIMYLDLLKIVVPKQDSEDRGLGNVFSMPLSTGAHVFSAGEMVMVGQHLSLLSARFPKQTTCFPRLCLWCNPLFTPWVTAYGSTVLDRW